MNLMTILLQAGEIATPAATETASKGAMGGGSLNFLVMMALIIAAMYFFMIRPQQRKQKEIQKFRSSLEKGSKVITAGGIYGTVKEIHDFYFILEVDNNVSLRVDKASVMKAPDAVASAPAKK